MPEATETPAPPIRDLGKAPTLLETLASQMDLSDAPIIKPRELPSISENTETITRPESKTEPKTETPPDDETPPEKPEEKKKREDAEKAQQDEWKKAGETISEKLFRKKPKAEKSETKPPEKAAEKTTEEKPPEKKETTPTPRRKRASEAEITERAAAAAAEAATNAVAKLTPATKPEDKPAPKRPEDGLTQKQRDQLIVYQELEVLKPAQYKGITEQYLKSIPEIQEYVKTWAKENPGQTFDPDAEEHNAFFERIEPVVDEDDWKKAEITIGAKEIASQAVKPLNEKIAAMEQERARTTLEPVIQQKVLQSVEMLLNEFDPEIAGEIRKPDGVKELTERDPITAGILNHMAGAVSSLTAELVRLHDPNGGVNYDPANPAHKELSDFILSQEDRISKLPREDQMRDGKRFIGRMAFGRLAQDQKPAYWFLDQDDIAYLLAQKYAIQAKKIRDAEVEKFNATAERLGYQKIDGAKPKPKPAGERSAQHANGATGAPSPEAVSRTSLRTPTGKDGKPAPGEAEVILGSLFHRLRS